MLVAQAASVLADDSEPPSSLIPLARAALALHLTREQALRRVMSGRLVGQCIDGKWVVDSSSLTAALETQPD
jgi:hypothetical protein